MAETKKVGGVEEEKGKSPFNAKAYKDVNGASILNGEGQITTIPIPHGDVAGYNPETNKPLTKGNFVDEATFNDHRVYVLSFRIGKMQALAAKLTDHAVKLRKFGDPKRRAKFMRLERMKEQMAALELELENTEIDGA